MASLDERRNDPAPTVTQSAPATPTPVEHVLPVPREKLRPTMPRPNQPRSTERRRSPMAIVDGILFAFAGLAAIWLAYLLIQYGVSASWHALLLVPFWVLFTYLLLPRLHRILTQMYVPGYFIGRARTSDGLLGDPVNLALLGHEAQIHQAMTRAGWTRADDLSLASGRRIVTSTLSRRSYAEAPVSPLHLFDRQQDFAYQQEVAGSPSKRHHVRFWRCPDGWMLPGGYAVDWLAAGTYDRSVGLSLFTFQITHKIEQNTDIERDFIVATVTEANPAVEVEVIRNFSTGYHSRNGGGDLIQTDGDLPIVDLRNLDAAPLPAVETTDSRAKRPAATTFGALVAILEGFGLVLFGALLILLGRSAGVDPGELDPNTSPEEVRLGFLVTGVFVFILGVPNLGLGVATLFGRNWARLLLMIACVVTVISSFVANARGTETITLASLPGVAASILVLLALSSHPARDYAVHHRKVRKRVAASTSAR